MQSIDAYEDCLDFHLLTFEPAKESAADTIDAIFAACLRERATIIIKMTDQKPEGEQVSATNRAENFVTTIIDEPKKAEILVEILQTRAGSR